jgi:hypothetical protein
MASKTKKISAQKIKDEMKTLLNENEIIVEAKDKTNRTARFRWLMASLLQDPSQKISTNLR